MRKLISLSILLALISIGAFGAVAMSHDEGHDMDSNCIATKLDNAICPQGVFETAVHHVSALKIFGSALIVNNMFALLLFVFVFALLYIVIRDFFHAYDFRESYNSEVCFAEERTSYDSKKLVRWLSLFENSPGEL